MTQEDKELLLKDLSARWPHGVNVQIRSFSLNLSEPVILDLPIKGVINFASTDCVLTVTENGDIVYDPISNCKPYLRPMSSMAEEEKKELRLEQLKDENMFLYVINKSQEGDDSLLGAVIPHYAEDWANKNHFDYRGLIEKGLALEAPKDMYNI